MHDVAPARFSPSSAAPALDATAIVCLVAGNTVGGYICPPEWLVLGMFPPFVLGLVLVTIRCVVWPPPLLFRTWRAAAAEPSITWRLTAFVLFTRVAVLAGGLGAALLQPARIADSPRISANPAVSLPARWDAFWYLSIARYGYRWTPGHDEMQQNIAFFPAHPLAMRIAGDLVTIPASLLRAPDLLGGGDGRVIWGGVLASVLFFVLALSRLYRLAADDTGSAAAATSACVLLATYPFALFFSAPYSESLALLALVSLVLAWRTHDTRGGALWGVVLGLSRSNGWCVAVALLADRVMRGRGAPRWRGAWIVVAAAPLGALLYSLYVYHLTGHLFAWATAQHAWGAHLRPLAFVTRRWHTLEVRGFRWYIRRDPADLLSFVAAATMAVAACWMIVRRQWLYGLVILAYLAPAIAIDLPATGRQTAVLFPAFILLGARVKGRWLLPLAVVFAALQAWFAWRFFLWETPY
ncbi:MAG: putative integral rane protein [Acidobacteria bacterium]|nr:putative integral rane protein [Acidobacteriota bacterium]